MLIHTATGSVYDYDPEQQTCARLRSVDGAQLRRDGETVRVLRARQPAVGEPWVLILDLREDGIETVRMTSPVTRIETHDAVEA